VSTHPIPRGDPQKVEASTFIFRRRHSIRETKKEGSLEPQPPRDRHINWAGVPTIGAPNEIIARGGRTEALSYSPPWTARRALKKQAWGSTAWSM